MNREEKRKVVCELYKEGKTMRDISKEVHMSFSDIGSAIKSMDKKSRPHKNELSAATRALMLFKKGKTPVEVAISMNFDPSEVAEIYKQFWKLEGLHKLLYLYDILKIDASLLAKVHDVMKEYNLTKEDIINIVDYAGDYNYLIEEVEEQKRQLNRILEQLHNTRIALDSSKKDHLLLSNQIDNYNDICLQKASYIEDLDGQMISLEDQILKLKNSDEHLVKFENTAREKLETITKDSSWILRIAIVTVIESIRRDPKKLMLINNGLESLDSFEPQLLDLSKSLFEMMLKQLMQQTLIAEDEEGS
jgi:hypothetical protein